MKRGLLVLAVTAIGLAQNLADVLKQGETVFNKSCASGYCHGARGAGGGAPRIAARGFDQSFINDTVVRGIPTLLHMPRDRRPRHPCRDAPLQSSR
jgi:mono/diheme cytochrome c family protein